MERSLDLFNESGEPAWDTPAVAERKRLTRQASLVLDRLRIGPATNMELIPISTRFSARIHELRKQGFVIDTEYLDRARGLVLYSLRKEPKCVN